MNEEQLVEGAGSFWGIAPETPPTNIVPRKEWDLTERVVFETQETLDAHAALDQAECSNTECRAHHEEDCLCLLCEDQETNGFFRDHDDHDWCDDCDRCMECEDCVCD